MTNSYAIPLFIGGTALAILMLSFMIGILFVQKNKQNAYKRRLLEARVEEHEKTLNEVSKDLHDNVGQLLSFSLMNIEHLENFAVEGQQGLIKSANTVLNEALLTVRHISHSLSGNAIKTKGLINTLTEELDFVRASKKLNCNLEIKGKYQRLPPDKELAVFRIAQEAITNTIKHAKATSFNIVIDSTLEGLAVTFTDNGKSFNAAKFETRDGIGLSNMIERAKCIKGNLEITSTPTNGCSIRLALPATQPEESAPAKS